VNAVTVPLAPAGLSAAAGNTQAILSWNPANFAAGYKVKRAIVSGGPYTTVANVSSTAWTNTGLANGATYYFAVSATNTAGEGLNSGQISVMPQCFTPAIPAGLSAVMAGGQINLKWHSVSGAQSYTIQRSTTNGGPYSLLAAGIITTNIVDPAVSLGTVYFYTVAASNVCGLSASSAEVSAPLLITSTITTPTNIIFNGWGGTPGAAYYLLSSEDPALPSAEWSIVATNIFGASGSFQATKFSPPTLPPHYFRIRTTAP
jgi:fibronectin type 3 domain-containing protein